MSNYFDIDIPNQNGYFYTNASVGDVVFQTGNANQRILVGTLSNNVPALMVSRSNTTMFGGLSMSNPTGVVNVTAAGTALNVGGTLSATGYSNLPIASTSGSGVVQLVAAVDSGSTSLAPTASALSNVYSLAVTASNKAYTPVINSQWTTNGSNVYITNSNVAIGATSAGNNALYVAGSTYVTGTLTCSNIDVLGALTTVATDVRVTEQFAVSNAGTGPALRVYQTGTEAISSFYDDSTIAVKIHDGGNMTVGPVADNSTFKGTEKLDVYGNVKANSNLYVVQNLGVGTSNPSNKAEIVGGALAVYPSAATGSNLVKVGGGLGLGEAGLWMAYDFTSCNAIIQAEIQGRAVGKTVLVNPYGGNVGIGASNPSNVLDKLHVVAGGARVDGTITAGTYSNLPSASTTIAGIVQLNSNLNANSVIQAPTSLALSNVYAVAVTASNKAYSAIDTSAITSGTLPVARGGTGTTTSTGTGSVVLSAAPTLNGPVNVSGAVISTSNIQASLLTTTAGVTINSNIVLPNVGPARRFVMHQDNATDSNYLYYGMGLEGNNRGYGLVRFQTKENGDFGWYAANVGGSTSAELMRLYPNGGLGIGGTGSNQISSKLRVLGTSEFDGKMTFTGVASGWAEGAVFSRAINGAYSNVAGYYISRGGVATNNYHNHLILHMPNQTEESTAAITFMSSGMNSLMTVRNTGNVGIGTNSPSSKLHVVGDINATTSVTTGSITATTYNGLPTASTTTAGIVQLNSNVNANSVTQAPTSLALSNVYALAVAASNKAYTPVVSSQWSYGATSNIVYVTGTNIGIGTSNPVEELHVANGNALIDGTIIATTYSNLPTASTSSQGIVQLDNTVTSTSTTTAPTSSALNNVYNLAVTSSNKAYDTPSTLSVLSNVLVGTTTNMVSNPLVYIHDTKTAPSLDQGLVYFNPNTVTTAHAPILVRTGGATGGNPVMCFDVLGVKGWTMGLDNADQDKFKIHSFYSPNFSTATETRLTITTAGDVGIGTTTPSSKLHVAGTLTATTYSGLPTASTTVAGIVQLNNNVNANSITQAPTSLALSNVYTLAVAASNKAYTPVVSSQWSYGATSNIVYVTGTNIGIGTSNPIEELHVANGNALIDGTIIATTYSNLPSATLNSRGVVQLNSNINSTSVTEAATPSAVKLTYDLAVTASNRAYTASSSQWTTNTSNIYITGSNVLIGTSVPSSNYALEVQGNAYVETLMCSNITAIGQFTTVNTTTTVTEKFAVNNAGTGPALTVTQTGTEAISSFYDDSVLAVKIHDGGNMTVGPVVDNTVFKGTERLDVYGNIKANSNLYVVQNLGVGTSNPTAKLHVIGDVFASTGFETKLDGYYLDNYWGFTNVNADRYGMHVSNYIHRMYTHNTTGQIRLSHTTTTEGSFVDRLTILPNGNVGIGTSNPLMKFHVSGNTQADGNIFLEGVSTGWGDGAIFYSRAINGAYSNADAYYISRGGVATNNYHNHLILHMPNSTEESTAAITFMSSGMNAFMTVRNSGNVGIGTLTPSAKLHVNGDVQVDGKTTTTATWLTNTVGNKILFANDATNSKIRYESGNAVWFESGRSNNATNEGAFTFRTGVPGVATGYKDRFTIESDGSTTSMRDSVRMYSNAQVDGRMSITPTTINRRKEILYQTVPNAASDHMFYGLGVDLVNGVGILNYSIDTSSANSAHVFYAASGTNTSSELMRIRGDGNIGVGTSNPTQKLHVVGNAQVDGTLTATTYAGLPASSTTIAGIVQLNTAVNSGSNNQAPTSSALSNVYSLAVTASNKAYGNFDASVITTGLLPIARGGTGTSTSTGSGSLVLASAPTLSNPTLCNCTIVGTASVSNLLTFPNMLKNKLIALNPGSENENEFFGFGIQTSTLRYQVAATNQNHVFYAALNSNVSVELARITGTGRLGIGTQGPSAPLHVIGNSIIEGSMGVGTSNPMDPLHVFGNVRIGSGSDTSKLFLNSVDGDKIFLTTATTNGTRISTSSGWGVQFKAGQSNSYTGGTGSFSFQVPSAGMPAEITNVNAQSSYSTVLYPGYRTRFEIDSDYNTFFTKTPNAYAFIVGSGPSNLPPEDVLTFKRHGLSYVANPNIASFMMSRHGPTNSSESFTKLTIRVSGHSMSNYDVMTILPQDVAGNLPSRVGINTLDPQQALHVVGNIFASGTVTTSDERVKDNITIADTNICYNAVKNLPLKRFTWTVDTDVIQDINVTGWIAQDVEQVFPKAIHEVNMHGYSNFKLVNKDQIYSSMYGALQKSIEKIEALEATVQSLQSQIDLLKVSGSSNNA